MENVLSIFSAFVLQHKALKPLVNYWKRGFLIELNGFLK